MKVLLLLAALTVAVLAAPPDRYAVVDRHALAAPAEVEKDVKALARYLCKRHWDAQKKRWVSDDPSFTDELGARAIFRWMAERMVYDLKDRTLWDSARVLGLRHGACHEFAVLYQALAEAAGLECRYVAGQAWYLGVLGPHAWNLVLVNGQWRPLDVTWACRWRIDQGELLETPLQNEWFLMRDGLYLLTHTPDSEQYGRQYIQEQQRSHHLLDEADARAARGDLKGALAACQEALRVAWSPEVFAKLAELNLKHGDLRAALTNCNLAINHSPNRPGPYLTKGLIKERLNDLPGALKELDRALKLDPTLQAAKAARKRIRAALFLVN